MNRRNFLATSLSSALTAQTASHAPMSPIQTVGSQPRELYQLRRYTLPMGPQTALAEHFFADALLPALTRLGFGPAGAFRLDIGPETPTYYVLIAGTDAAALATLDEKLALDNIFLRAADPFWTAPAASPAFHRIDASLLLAFQGWPKLVVPARTKRIFQLRTYESPSHVAHIRKLEMFNGGEFEIFQHTGLHPVFFGQTLIGARLPSLTYMLTFADQRELEANWAAFSADPAWKKLQADPRYAYEPIVSNITNLILSPLPCSQI